MFIVLISFINFTEVSANANYFYLVNATKRTGILYATDDLNGAADRNAELITTLNAREIYYVVVYNHNENCGCTLFFGDNKTIIGGLEIM